MSFCCYRNRSESIVSTRRIEKSKMAHLGHGSLALEAAPDPVINTLGLSPCLLHAMVAVRLMAPGGIISSEYSRYIGRGRT